MPTISATISIKEINKQLNQYSISLETIKDYSIRNEELKSFFIKLGHTSIRDDLRDFTVQLNFLGFLTVSVIDLLVISKNMLRAEKWWEQVSQIRLGYLIIYSVLEAYNKHSTELKKASKKNPHLNSLFETITSEIRKFKKTHDYPSKFKTIRNSTIGHIEIEFASFHDTLRAISILPSYEAILDFTIILATLLDYKFYHPVLRSK